MKCTLVSVTVIFVMCSPALLRAQNYSPINANLDVDQTRLDTVLATPLSIRTVDKPLREITSEIAADMGMPIYLDLRALAESGIADDSPVTVSLTAARLETVLASILEPLELQWVPRHEGIVITTPDAAAERPLIRVYPVYDLVTIQAERAVIDFDSLMETITSTVDTDTWEENGGNGSIEPFNGSLVISQTWHVHRKVERTLFALRAAHDQAPADWSTTVRNSSHFQRNAGTGRKVYSSPIQSRMIRGYMFPSKPTTEPTTRGGFF